MAIQIKVPGSLRSKTGGVTEIEVNASDVEQALRAFEEACPTIVDYLRDENGALRPRVNIYVNDEHVRFRQGTRTPLRDGDRVYIVPVVMGG